MRRTKKMSLVFLGATSVLSACGQDAADELNRTSYSNTPRYNSREECLQEWQDNKACTRDMTGAGYLGPRYFFNHGTGNAYAVYPDGSQTSVPATAKTAHSDMAYQAKAVKTKSGGLFRFGGFGSSARAGSAGG